MAGATEEEEETGKYNFSEEKKPRFQWHLHCSVLCVLQNELKVAGFHWGPPHLPARSPMPAHEVNTMEFLAQFEAVSPFPVIPWEQSPFPLTPPCCGVRSPP